ncbi:MAG: hypothetical protein ACXWAT_12830 [Methylobacter sp.]
MDKDDLDYALAKQIPSMERGFEIATAYGTFTIEAEDSDLVIKAVKKTLERKLAGLNKD